MSRCSIEEIEEGVRRLFSNNISMPIEQLPIPEKSRRIVKIKTQTILPTKRKIVVNDILPTKRKIVIKPKK